mmetsp:Transcript_102512/g.182145  ORF Transcript_102512/g.182145 Transcript_102512/m.182145 type:complete len:261 (-) Transcript_102512:79-861(-)
MVSCPSQINFAIQCNGTGRDTYLTRDPHFLLGIHGAPLQSKDSEARWLDNLRSHQRRRPYSASGHSSSAVSSPSSSTTLNSAASSMASTRSGTAFAPAMAMSPWLHHGHGSISRNSSQSSLTSAVAARDKAARDSQGPGSHSALRAASRAAKAQAKVAAPAGTPLQQRMTAPGRIRPAKRGKSKKAQSTQDLKAAAQSEATLLPEQVPEVKSQSKTGSRQNQGLGETSKTASKSGLQTSTTRRSSSVPVGGRARRGKGPL